MTAEIAVVLPGQDTMLRSWEALTTISAGARLVRGQDATVAVFPDWAPLNNAILHAPVDRAPSVAAEVAAAYEAAGVPSWALWLPTGARSFEAADTVRSVGRLHRDVSTLVMRADLTGPLRRPDARVRRTTVAAATRATDDAVPVAELEPPEAVPGLDAWVLCVDGLAVCGAWSCRHGGDCGVYTIGTVPDHRRRGLARALVDHVLGHAQRLGARTASLQSTPMGQPLYASLGFAPAGRYDEWASRP
jgi:GNAT superfamily N-acetyltransferase